MSSANASQATLTGTLKPDGTLELDQKPSLPAGRVRVTLVLEEIAPTQWKEHLSQVLARIDRERLERGEKGRTREEIDASVTALRDELEERLDELEQIREEGRRSTRA
jgi:hypothetical protein